MTSSYTEKENWSCKCLLLIGQCIDHLILVPVEKLKEASLMIPVYVNKQPPQETHKSLLWVHLLLYINKWNANITFKGKGINSALTPHLPRFLLSKAPIQEYSSIYVQLGRKEGNRKSAARINPEGMEDEKWSGTGTETATDAGNMKMTELVLPMHRRSSLLSSLLLLCSLAITRSPLSKKTKLLFKSLSLTLLAIVNLTAMQWQQ